MTIPTTHFRDSRRETDISLPALETVVTRIAAFAGFRI
jgi:hypothetical protein